MKIGVIIGLLIHLSTQWCFFTSFSEQDEKILSVDYSPDGQFIATGSSSNRVSIFNTKTYDVVWFETLSNDVLDVKFTHDGTQLGVTQNSTDTVKIYNISGSGEGTQVYSGDPTSNNDQGFNEIDFNPNHDEVVLCGNF